MSIKLLQRTIASGPFLRAAESRILTAGLQQAPPSGSHQPPLQQQQPHHTTAAPISSSLSFPSLATCPLSSLHPIAFGNMLSHQARCLLLTSTLDDEDF
ncbi:hypothetical protein DUNSADRAFT_86 [Dunaliella salina]|uniref:Encoded protein n=1 Tax=Dunaliella salina TaxID=3046 RepID=A0ABQ7H8U9_DUNSA|nr:hypothetical protein DUNSADRAFT_86 [Dunaliella salina]|eukprot:KAF5843284.1 hypothetical protein DUNSADRAFT_86 [Dunaliella salina]